MSSEDNYLNKTNHGNNIPPKDLAVILETDFLELLRTVGMFLVLGVAIFTFTNSGKIFSLISLGIALIINIMAVFYYFRERYEIAKKKCYPRTFIDVLALIMVFLIFFIGWIMYEVYLSKPSASLNSLAKRLQKSINRRESLDLSHDSHNADLDTQADKQELLDVIKIDKIKTRVEDSALASVS